MKKISSIINIWNVIKSMKNNITSETLEGVWLSGVKNILNNGNLIESEDPFFEFSNLYISYANAFEIETTQYEKVFGKIFLDYMRRVYSSSGDKESGRNYYNLIFKQNGVNQVEKVIKLLSADPLSRSAIIILSTSNTDKKPCVSEISFSIRNNLLHMTVVFKSSDFAKKFIPDMVELSKIHKQISQSLNISRGDVCALILCAQLYTSDKKVLSKVISRLRKSNFFKTEKVVENWDKEAEKWNENINNPNHYVNFENGYSRFLKFIDKEIPSVSESHSKIALDSGCGTGVISKVLNKKGYTSVGADLSPKMLERADKRKDVRKYLLANSLDLPYGDNVFDIVCSRGVLISHVGKKYVDFFIKEHFRVLKNGGLCMFDFITHFDPSEIKKKRAKASMTFNEVSEILVSYGFEVISRSGEDSNRVNAILCKK